MSVSSVTQKSSMLLPSVERYINVQKGATDEEYINMDGSKMPLNLILQKVLIVEGIIEPD